jgi:hypothetical protein
MLGSLFAKKPKPEEELLHLPGQTQDMWNQTAQGYLGGQGGMTDPEYLLNEKRMRDSMARLVQRGRQSVMDRYRGMGQANTPGMSAALNRLNLQGMGQASTGTRDLAAQSMAQAGTNRNLAFSTLGGMYNQRRVEVMPDEEQKKFNAWRA